MEPEGEELQRLVDLVRANIITAGFAANRLEDRYLRATARWLHASRLALQPFPLAIAYLAIAWTIQHKEELDGIEPAGD